MSPGLIFQGGAATFAGLPARFVVINPGPGPRPGGRAFAVPGGVVR